MHAEFFNSQDSKNEFCFNPRPDELFQMKHFYNGDMNKESLGSVALAWFDL